MKFEIQLLANLTLGNPAGFWALLGIPAVILIHFLQRQARVVTISTLFLLEQTQRESLSGKRFERLRSSIPLWLQLLAVGVMTWLLVGPRWMRTDSAQRIAIVLDSSSSMVVFKEKLIEALDEHLAGIESNVSTSEFIILDSDLKKRTIYSGTDRKAALEAVKEWTPRATAHDFGRPLRVARSLAGPKGLIILATDHIPTEKLPLDAHYLSVGEPTENCGLAGLSMEPVDGQLLWKALIRNYSDRKQTRTWHLKWSNKTTSSRSVTLEPKQILPIQDAFPEGTDDAILVMESDAFPLDDIMPMRRPAEKELRLWQDTSKRFGSIFSRVVDTFDDIEQIATLGDADLVFTSYDPLNPVIPNKPAFVCVDHKGKQAPALEGNIFLERHPLVDGLNWQGLICRDGISIPIRESDTILVWQGDRPLVFLRESDDYAQVIFNFDIASSNADRIPAFVVMFHRYLASMRADKVALESTNLETGQSVSFAFDPSPDAGELSIITRTIDGEELESNLTRSQAYTMTAPADAGFLEVRQGESPLLRAGVHFADSREADLSKAASGVELQGVDAAMVTVHSSEDKFWRWWMLGLAAVLIISWYFVRRQEPNGMTNTEQAPATPSSLSTSPSPRPEQA